MTKKLPHTIRLRITKGDLEKAGPYFSCNCLLHTALKRKGFDEVDVVSYGKTTIDGMHFEPEKEFSSSVVLIDGLEANGYRPEVVGMQMTLRRVE